MECIFDVKSDFFCVFILFGDFEERVGSIEKGVGSCGRCLGVLSRIGMRGIEMMRDGDEDDGRGRY